MSKSKGDPVRIKKDPTFGESIFALSVLFIFIGVGYLGFRLRVELLMIASAACVAFMAIRNGYTWSELEGAISTRMGKTTPAILIMWVIGVVIATFLFAGSIPMLIYYGIIYVSPKYVIACACLACLVFSITTGTSWGSAGTVGVAFMGIAAALNLPLHITAAAVISGAVFGDKLSPLSDTTNLAAACTGVDLYEHIRSMVNTTLPPTLIALIVYSYVGSTFSISLTEMPESALELIYTLDSLYKWGILPLIPFLIILVGAITKKPPVPTMLFASLVAVCIGVGYQGFSLFDGFDAALNGFKGTMIPVAGELSPAAKTLLNRGGMKSMVSIVVVIYCGYSYASILSKGKFLETAIQPLAARVQGRVGLMMSALFFGLILTIFSGIAYTGAIMLPEMYKKLFIKAGMPPKTLSRTIEDGCTMTVPFVPWGSSGAFYVSVLGVSIYGMDGYAIWYMLGYLTPVFSIMFAATGWRIYKLSKEEIDEELRKYEEEQKLI